MAIVSKKNFDVIESDSREGREDDYFECDELIAPVISVLNKKGYTTKNCCSGHPFETINFGRIKPQAEDSHLSPFQLKEKYGYYSVSAKDKEGWYNVSQREWFAFEAYIDFASFVELPSMPEGFEFDGRMIRYSYYDDNDEELVNDNPYLFFRKRLDVMDHLYIWAKSLPEYDSIISEKNRKERHFQADVAPSIIEEYISTFLSAPDAKEAANEFREFAKRELFYITTNQMIQEGVQYLGFKDIPVDEKESYFRGRLDKIINCEDDRYLLSCNAWSREFDDMEEMLDHIADHIISPDLIEGSDDKRLKYEKELTEFWEMLQGATWYPEYFEIVLNENGTEFLKERDFKITTV